MSNAARSRKKPLLKVKVVAPALAGTALLQDMEAYRGKVTASRASAREFLMGLGVLSQNGKTKRLIRG